MHMLSNKAHYFLVATPIVPWVMLTFGFWLVEDGVIHGWRRKLPNIFCGLAVCLACFVTAPFIVQATKFVTGHVGNGFIDIDFLPAHPALSYILSAFFFVLVFDFFYYWWHRAEHKIQVLWDIHAVHHSEESFNATSYMRQSWIDGILQGLLVQAPVVVLFHFTPEAQYTSFLIIAAWNFFGHSDLKWEMGKWSGLLTGPQLHRLHHSKLKQHHDRNFAQFFPVWDVLFGTYVKPLPGEFPPTGLDANHRIQTPRDFLDYPIKSWLRRMRAATAKA